MQMLESIKNTLLGVVLFQSRKLLSYFVKKNNKNKKIYTLNNNKKYIYRKKKKTQNLKQHPYITLHQTQNIYNVHEQQRKEILYIHTNSLRYFYSMHMYFNIYSDLDTFIHNNTYKSYEYQQNRQQLLNPNRPSSVVLLIARLVYIQQLVCQLVSRAN